MGLAPGALDDAEGDVTGAAGDVENPIVLAARRVERRDHRILPDSVQPGRHHVVHDVVAFGDLVEDVVDERLLLARADFAETERGLHSAPRRYALIRHTKLHFNEFCRHHSEIAPCTLSEREATGCRMERDIGYRRRHGNGVPLTRAGAMNKG